MWCSTSHVSIHIENEWSYLLINIYQHYGIWDEHIWCFMNDLNILVNHNVLSYFIYPYTPWKRMIIAVVELLSIVSYIRLCAVCLYEWSRLSCQSYASWPISHVTIHLAQPLSTICYIRCMYLMLVWKMLPVFLAYPPCPYTNWKRMILPSDQLLPTVCYMWCI